MRFEPSLVQGTLIRRYKRFLADVELENGQEITVHCANPGAMTSCAPPGAQVWLSRSNNPKRKLAYSWEVVHAFGEYVGVHTGRANDLVAEGIHDGVVVEAIGYEDLRREVKTGDSRLDFCLKRGNETFYLEVKNVSLDVGEKVAAFPDSVTKRGTKHLHELARLHKEGHRVAVLFLCSRANVRSIRPADEIDPVYGRTLRVVASQGVEVLGYGCHVTPEEIRMTTSIPVLL